MVAARAVIRDWNGEISPLCSLVFSSLGARVNTDLRAYPRFRHGKNFRRMVKKTPVPTSSTSMYGPHTKSLTTAIISEKLIFSLPFLNIPVHFTTFHVSAQVAGTSVLIIRSFWPVKKDQAEYSQSTLDISALS
ncbi:hypothetical protein SDC9_169422 [bioreactor metagenome]|uniref:Uncharacterized protein n=1 Tax=bioreactor metagenome TaxID=1076179 RepID=A0A645G8C6_9ZZZZ